MMNILLAFQLLLNVIPIRSDYGCLCIRGGTLNVYLQPFVLSQVLGQLKDRDCKPTYTAGTSANWMAIQFHNQVGFITNTSVVNFYNCQGNSLDKDAFSTAGPTKQTTASSTLIKLTSSSTSTKATKLTISTQPTKRTTTTGISAAALITTFPKTSTTGVSTLTTTQMLHCPPAVKFHHGDYLEHNGHCYEFIKTPHKSWPDAEHDCNTRGGHLVSITSQAEQSFIKTELWRRHSNLDDKHVWIGLTDKDSEGNWKWSSGERTTFTFWNKGNPGGYFEDCALLDMDRISHWVDYPCTGFLFSVQKHGYICEYNLV